MKGHLIQKESREQARTHIYIKVVQQHSPSQVEKSSLRFLVLVIDGGKSEATYFT
jgi:hypothetical protein